MEQKFLICKHCGKMVAVVKETGVPVICCGEEMSELIPGTTDAAAEKHVPVVTVDGRNVKVAVGSVAHPMLPEHYIEWISLHTSRVISARSLSPVKSPKHISHSATVMRSSPHMPTAICIRSGRAE